MKEENSKKELSKANQMKLIKKIDKNKKLPADYTGTFIDYFDADGEPVPTQTGAATAVVNEFKNGKRVQEVFIGFRQGGVPVGREEGTKGKESPKGKEGSKDPTGQPAAGGKTPAPLEKGKAPEKAPNRI